MSINPLLPGLLALLFVLTGAAAYAANSISSTESAGSYVQIAAVDNYSAYYDGHYGTIIDGYWGRDGKFWYQDRNERWHSDDANHFQHDAANGLKRIQGSGGPRTH